MGRSKREISVVSFILLIITISLSSAIDTYSQNSDVDLKHPVRLNGAVSSGINCNISIYKPDNTVLIDFEPMTDNGDYFNYTLNSTQTAIKGIYNYDVTCIGGGENQTDSFDFLINLGGVEPSDSRTHTQTRNILIFFGLALMFFISIFLSKSFPIKLTFFLCMIWFMLMGINFAYISIGDEVLNSNVENFFSFFLTISYYANYFIFVAIIILWMITLFVNISNINKQKKAMRYGTEGM